jgi:hypothetical protein
LFGERARLVATFWGEITPGGTIPGLSLNSKAWIRNDGRRRRNFLAGCRINVTIRL